MTAPATLEAPAAPKGLSSVPQLAAESEQSELERLAFPTAQLVDAAVSLFHKSPLWAASSTCPAGKAWVGPEGRTFLLTVSPGTVTVALRDPVKLERNALNALGHETRGTSEVYAAPRTVLDLGDGDTLTLAGHGLVKSPGGLDLLDRWADDGELEFRDLRPQRQVEGWSRKSRARMVRTLAQLDWAPMYEDGRAAVMVTLTYPADWLTVAPNGQAVKEHLDTLMKRWARHWHVCSSDCRVEPRKGRKIKAAPTKDRWPATTVRWVTVHAYRRPPHPWKLEFQRRGAPHLHLMVVPPRSPEFRSWLSRAWSEVVGHPDPLERRKHQLAGTGVDYLRGGRCFDPKRAAVYFSKHGGAAGGKEYQNTVPLEWQEPGAGPGRFWGYVGLSKATAAVAVEPAEYVQLRRTLRRWSQSQGLTRTQRVPRGASVTTGVVRYRTVTRTRATLAYGGMSGGTVLVNDGPAFAAKLSRLPAIQRAETDRARDTEPSGFGAWSRASARVGTRTG